MDDNNRFMYILDELKKNGTVSDYVQIASQLGTNKSGINDIKGGRKKPSLEILRSLKISYPNVNVEWIITGCGRPFIDTSTENTDNTSLPKLPVATISTCPGEGIPLIPINAMAGALTDEQTILEYECERYVVPMFKGADFLIPVKGSSMYPKYSSGDIVACQRVHMSDLFFQWNKVYVIDTTQGALIKRIKPGSADDRVLIVSDNPKYDPFELPLSAIRAVALVIGVIRLE